MELSIGTYQLSPADFTMVRIPIIDDQPDLELTAEKFGGARPNPFRMDEWPKCSCGKHMAFIGQFNHSDEQLRIFVCLGEEGCLGGRNCPNYYITRIPWQPEDICAAMENLRLSGRKHILMTPLIIPDPSMILEYSHIGGWQTKWELALASTLVHKYEKDPHFSMTIFQATSDHAENDSLMKRVEYLCKKHPNKPFWGTKFGGVAVSYHNYPNFDNYFQLGIDEDYNEYAWNGDGILHIDQDLDILGESSPNYAMGYESN